jgi:hypothetical protein
MGFSKPINENSIGIQYGGGTFTFNLGKPPRGIFPLFSCEAIPPPIP